jgi:hypothetical protein
MPIPARIQTEDQAFLRDTHSKGLLCTDLTALQRHRRKIAETKSRADMSQQFDSLKSRVDELTDMMRLVLEKLNAI